MSKLFEVFGIIDSLQTYGNFDDIEDVYTLFSFVKKQLSFQKNLRIGELLHKIELYQKYGFRVERQVLRGKTEGVQVLTAHSSKGMEYETVFIPHLISGNWDDKGTRTLIPLPENIAGS